jgi:GNAT superfamily N-acetyltransferase
MQIPDFMGQHAVYSPEWANAAPLDESRSVYEALYTAWSAAWVSRGAVAHLVSLLAADRDMLPAWQWLGFGMLVLDGLRDLSPLPVPPSPHLQIRQVLPHAQGAFSESDLALLARFDRALLDHLLAAPCFWPHEVEEASSFSGPAWLSAPGNALWFAYQGDEPLGYLGITPSSQDACTIIRDPGTASIVKAYTLPSARGSGVGAALLDHALLWARGQGFQRCSVDFESANLPACRFWMRWFDPVVYSLMRVVLVTSEK